MKHVLTLLFVCGTFATASSQVTYAGSMGEMGKTNFAPVIGLDTLQGSGELTGLGPLGRMEGEITVLRGVPHHARVRPDGTVLVSQSWQVGAPFFVYARVPAWDQSTLEATVSGQNSLQALIEEQALKQGRDLSTPFPFTLAGVAAELTLHVVMPRSPEVPGYEEGKKQQKYSLKNREGELVGFYSRSGQGIYTHKDSYIHVHFVSNDRTVMGHVDQLELSGPFVLSLPKK